MQDRIEINGVWYIREDIANKEEEEDFELSFYQSAIHEDDMYCFEATRFYKTDLQSSFFDDIDIKFTDKRVKPWKEEHWDNNAWMKGVLNNDLESMKELNKDLCPSGIKTFQMFLKKLKEEEWLK